MAERLLRFVVNEKWIRKCYDEYVGDVAWYRENDQLEPSNPDPGYRTGDPGTFDEYRAELLEDTVAELLHADAAWPHKLERVDALSPTSGTAL